MIKTLTKFFAAFAILVYCKAACCKYVPKNKDIPIKIKYLKNNFLFEFISSLIFPLSNIKAMGNTVKNPTKNLEALNVNGPILSIPVSWAIKAVPQINVVISAQISDEDLDI